ncbi:hypothetical protein HanHA89_Chr08g0302161 [Helianthus annuus]|nr:hypothetical protein HanHA89_Chr08g0302161 [Helianthus annuus]
MLCLYFRSSYKMIFFPPFLHPLFPSTNPKTHLMWRYHLTIRFGAYQKLFLSYILHLRSISICDSSPSTIHLIPLQIVNRFCGFCRLI